MRGTAVVGGRTVIPDNQHFVVTFEASHCTHVAFPAVLLSPLPMRTTNYSYSNTLHLLNLHTNKVLQKHFPLSTSSRIEFCAHVCVRVCAHVHTCNSAIAKALRAARSGGTIVTRTCARARAYAVRALHSACTLRVAHVHVPQKILNFEPYL